MINTRDLIIEEMQASYATVQRLMEDTHLHTAIETAANILTTSLKAGGKVLLAGNGGSAADAQHIAAEFVGRLKFDRTPLSAIALTADTSIVTAIANDFGYAELFSRQVAGYGRRGDVFIGITTSGQSENVLRGFAAAKRLNIATIALCGEPGLANETPCDCLLACPSKITARIQECHTIVAHILCDIVEKSLFGQDP